jgi:DNA invertase Pin-like site-specific DNA recombinase
MKKVFVYHRVSSDQQLDGSGIARQAELLEGYLERTGICAEMDDPAPVVLSDQGVSAFKGLNISEGELGAWMEQVRNGMWDSSILVVESIDRFSRQNPFDVMGYINALMAHNVAIHDVMANIVISRSNSKDLPFVMMNAQRAYDESKYKSDRIRKGWAKKREHAFNKGTI